MKQEVWAPVQGVFSLIRISGTNNMIVCPVHAENLIKKEALSVSSTDGICVGDLTPILSGMVEMPGGKKDSHEVPGQALFREMSEEVPALYLSLIHHPFVMQQILLQQQYVCYQENGSKRYAIEVLAFYLSTLASSIQTVIDSGIARIMPISDSVQTAQLRPYQNAFMQHVYKGEICLPTQ